MSIDQDKVAVWRRTLFRTGEMVHDMANAKMTGGELADLYNGLAEIHPSHGATLSRKHLPQASAACKRKLREIGGPLLELANMLP